MKIRNLFIPLILTLTVASFSCSDYSCTKASLIFGLTGFSDTEADTIIIRRFEKNDNINVKDSFLIDHISFNRNNDTLKMGAFPSTATLESDFNYELFFPETGKLIRITDIQEEQLEKKRGLFNSSKVGCENRITSYKKDGQISTSIEYNLTYIPR
jgi:hypothetical protein